MRVRYIGKERASNFTPGEIKGRIGGFILNETYEVIDILQVCDEIFYLTTNNMEEKWYFKSKLFEIVEE